MSELNPFAVNRAEYMRDLWKYYVPLKELDLETSKALVGRCAGYWSVYTGMQKLISDCLIVVKEPSDATIEALRNHSENGRLQIPLRGVSTPYITIDDVRSLLLNN